MITAEAWEAFAWNTPADVENSLFARWANFERTVNGHLVRSPGTPLSVEAFSANGFSDRGRLWDEHSGRDLRWPRR